MWYFCPAVAHTHSWEKGGDRHDRFGNTSRPVGQISQDVCFFRYRGTSISQEGDGALDACILVTADTNAKALRAQVLRGHPPGAGSTFTDSLALKTITRRPGYGVRISKGPTSIRLT